MSSRADERRWWLLITQLPTNPAYVRVKVGRRLQRLGAVAIKNSVYALPYGDETQEDFQWLLREIQDDGGEASLVEARLVDGMSDRQVEGLFVEARLADYKQLLEDLEPVVGELGKGELTSDARRRGESELARFRERFDELREIEFFPTGKRQRVESLLAKFEQLLKGQEPASVQAVESIAEYRGRTWVTRKGIKVDRIASAWLIRRFIDPRAKFKFVAASGYKPQKRELRFDMFEAEFTHEGDKCTFETLIARMRLDDRALTPIAEIVHDIDIKDGKFGRNEASGVALLIDAIASPSNSDEARLAQGSAVFDNLYDVFKRKPA